MSVQVVGGTLVQKAISGFAKSHKMFLERYKQAGWNPESAVLPYNGLGTSILSGEFQEVYQALVWQKNRSWRLKQTPTVKALYQL